MSRGWATATGGPVWHVQRAAPGPSKVTVIGSGACGSIAALRLAQAGVAVRLLEAGLDVADHEPASSLAERQAVQSLCGDCRGRERRFFADDVAEPYLTEGGSPFAWIRGRCLGGRTQMWNGVCLRLEPDELGPQNPSRADGAWAVEHARLERAYARLEDLLGIERGAADDSVRGAQLSSNEQQLVSALLRRWPNAIVRLVPYARGLGGGRWTSPAGALAQADASGNLELLTGMVARRLVWNRLRTRIVAVECFDVRARAVRSLPVDAVLLAASTIESTRLLLSSSWPLAEAPGVDVEPVLGRYLSEHLLVGGLFATAAGGRDERRTGKGIYLRVPEHGAGLLGFQSQFYVDCVGGTKTLKAVAFGEAEALASNRICLSHDVRDAYGMPAVRVEYRRSAADERLATHMVELCNEAARCAGFTIVRPAAPAQPGLSVHEVGTARMGAHPGASVVDGACRSWHAPNVFVADGAAFPRAGYSNPTLTMMALAQIAADRLLDDYSQTGRREPRSQPWQS